MNEKRNLKIPFPLSGKTIDLSVPVVMGILNVTPDSFYDGGKHSTIDAQLKQVEMMLAEGASIIDIGAVSARPGAKEVCQTGELERLLPSLRAIRHHFPGCFLSVDTCRPLIARAMVDHGADLINDIYGGTFDAEMIEVIATLKVPYIIMHMQGTPETMQQNPVYEDVVAEVKGFFDRQLAHCTAAGTSQVIVDPGFGFGKTVGHNYALLARLNEFHSFGVPVMAGLSRKSMINRVLNTKPGEALNGTTVLNTIALLNGADILRVHDVREACEAIKLVLALDES